MKNVRTEYWYWIPLLVRNIKSVAISKYQTSRIKYMFAKRIIINVFICFEDVTFTSVYLRDPGVWQFWMMNPVNPASLN